MLLSAEICNNKHKMIVLDRGECEESQAKFYTSPYGLGVDLTTCSKPFMLDHSLNSDPWYLKEIVLKTPAEHSTVYQGTVKSRRLLESYSNEYWYY